MTKGIRIKIESATKDILRGFIKERLDTMFEIHDNDYIKTELNIKVKPCKIIGPNERTELTPSTWSGFRTEDIANFIVESL